MRLSRALTVLIALAAGLPAAASCPADQATVLSCSIQDDAREVNVCIAGSEITYTFGKPESPPELLLREPVATVLHDPWTGIGRTIWEAVTFTNQGFAYEVAISVDRMAENHPTQGSVTVYQNDTIISRFRCDGKDTVIGLWAVMGAKEIQGICWRPRQFQWATCK